ncbi:hypothetical protein DSM106972_097510 [Dulcicalothrix desertica PCC 7102]|uniref:Uncharacterized protein n=1 Tax=Dulcicalothrix desertica PCC 7102 TaxID=232991 RepID=A0A3S1CIP5_9CYAN|nr:hypothetical protein [Dulcicalothrix desertica]RUS93119.1 hypothetical protein DSM106972_097510 [Dulcicalothrix desertica PCC 7102]TWH61195.1 hypothetical protein CAL7102_01050 [Dulcicalothrix desertica PCC 7102]
MSSDLVEIQETIDAWFIANKQQALDNLLIAVWNQIESNDYTIAEILRSLVKYVNHQGLSQVASSLEEIAIRLEELNDTDQ